MATRLKRLKITELSILTAGNPANPGARVGLLKSADPAPTQENPNMTDTLPDMIAKRMAASNETESAATLAVLDTPEGQAAYNAQEVAKWHKPAAAPVAVVAKSDGLTLDSLVRARMEKKDESYIDAFEHVAKNDARFDELYAREDAERAARARQAVA